MDRRVLLASTFALAACDGRPAASQVLEGPLVPLKDIAPFPVGTCGMTDQFRDAQWTELATTHFSQLTPEWEMKMEYILGNGHYRWEAPDAVAEFAETHGMALFGTTLIWYSQGRDYFDGLNGRLFVQEFDRYIRAVVSRYRGRVTGWDVINEAVAEDGDGLRDCHWSQRLGEEGYIRRAFEIAADADPEAVLFINDYNLEHLPRKGATFLRLVERLLNQGTPIGGLGTQSHLDYDLKPGEATRFMTELAQFGLPIHVSELDVSFGRRRGDMTSVARRRELQLERAREIADAFMALPEHQRFAFTVWGVRDGDSWLRRGRWDDGRDEPLLFDWIGRPKPMLGEIQSAFRSAR